MTDERFEHNLKEASADLLRDVVRRREANLLPLLEPHALLTREDILALTKVISDEFSGAGLGIDYEPNEYGLTLETLLDDVNRHGFL